MSQRAPQFLAHFVLLLIYAIVLEYTVRSRDWFRYYPYIDNLMHFGWGAVIALAIIVFWRNNAAFVLLSIFIWQMMWEASEMVVDRLMHQPEYMQDHFFPDGMIDTAMDLLGAATVILLTRKSRRSSTSTSDRTVRPS